MQVVYPPHEIPVIAVRSASTSLKLLNKGDIVQQSSSSSPIAIVKRSNGDHNFNQHALIHGSKELQSELAGIFGGAGISDPMNR